MSKKIYTTAHYEDGRVVIHHNGRFIDGCAKFKGTFRIIAEKDTRKLNQNALYWVWNDIIAKANEGWDAEDAHAVNKVDCNGKHITWIDKDTGEIKDRAIPQSTARLSIDAFGEFMERVQRYWSEHGIDLPGSDEYFANLEKEP